MPFIRLETTETISRESKVALCAKLSKICSETIGKPEKYVMAAIHEELTILMDGKPGPAAFVEIRNIGKLTPETSRALSEKVCRFLAESLKISGERVYLNMLEVRGDAWGHDGGTFG